MTILTRRFGDRSWDGLLRGTGAVALIGIPIVTFAPVSGPLVAFVLFTILINGPVSFLLTVYEPVLMLFGRLYPPLLIAGLGIAGSVYVEYLNYRVFHRVLRTDRLSALRAWKTSRWIVEAFRRAPFATVTMAGLIGPYWVVRIASPLSGYPVARHLTATSLGRFPRLWFFATLGAAWQVDIRILMAIVVGTGLIGLITVLGRRAFKRRRAHRRGALPRGSPRHGGETATPHGADPTPQRGLRTAVDGTVQDP